MAREDLEIVIGASLDGLSSDLARAARMMRALGKEVEKNQPQWRGAAFADSAVRDFRSMAGSAMRAGSGIRSAAGELAGFTAKAAGAAIVLRTVDAGIAGIGDAMRQVKDSVRLAADLEQTTLAFEVMLGSAEKAKTMIGDFRDYAAKSPFGSNDIINAGRALLGYGVAADQVMPTLRMLGDVSAGIGKRLPIKELTEVYGRNFATGRMHTVDVNEFRGRGVQIDVHVGKALKKSKEEIEELIDAGRIGKNELNAAFASMTSKGGEFYRMTERQGQTLAGTWEQMADAFEMAKTKFGQIVIRETGLKEVVGNTEKFAKALDEGMERIAPAVRFVGDLARAGGQVAYEIGRAAVKASEFAGALGEAVAPGVMKRFREFQEYLQGVRKDFKIDPVDVLDVTHSITDGLAGTFADTLRGIKSIGSGLHDWILEPLQKGFRHVILQWQKARNMVVEVPAKDRFMPPAYFETDEGILDRFKDLWEEQLRARDSVAAARKKDRANRLDGFDRPNEIGPEERKARSRLDDLDLALVNYLKVFSVPQGEALRSLGRGVVPAMGGRDSGITGDGGRIDRLIADIDAGRKAANALKQDMRAEIERKQWADRAQTFRNEALAPAGRALLGPWASAAGQLPDGFGAPASGAGLKPSTDLSPPARDLLKELKNRFDPLSENSELMQKKRDLTELKNRGLITQGMFDLSWAESVRGVAERLGVGQPARLTDAVQVGTQDDARLLAQFATGNATQTTEGLLKQIRDLIERLVGTNKQMAEAPMPRPVNVGVPGGG